MATLVHHLVEETAQHKPYHIALKYRETTISYKQLHTEILFFANKVVDLSLIAGDRIGIYAEKRVETVVAMLGTSKAGCVFVPINPLLKPDQVAFILDNCSISLLVTTLDRLSTLLNILHQCKDLKHIIVMADVSPEIKFQGIKLTLWSELKNVTFKKYPKIIDQDIAAILYTSGSTGKPKGVILSHRNIVAGAISVSEYLELNESDRLLAVLPLSFDYGMNQLTTMFLVGGCVVLMNHLFPKDIITLLDKEKITGLAGVPPLWIQLVQLQWQDSITEHLRFITNSGGHMPKETLASLRNLLPRTKPYLMYGLTEAFRSTYLPPSEIETRQDSMGKAIPNAEILVVRPDGTPCRPEEPGELVHRGVHVALGYWNNPEKTAERFKPCPMQNKCLPITELAVWSGDIVKKDKDGYLYYVGRNDETIKTSGYRVSPSEIEEMFYSSKLVVEVVAFGVPHSTLGHAIYVIVKLTENNSNLSETTLKLECQKRLPAYMVPHFIEITKDNLLRNSNGKIDRKTLSTSRKNQIGDDSAGALK